MEYVICFMCSISTLASVMAIAAVYILSQYFKELRQDMKGVMTSYKINIGQVVDLIDKLFDKVK